VRLYPHVAYFPAERDALVKNIGQMGSCVGCCCVYLFIAILLWMTCTLQLGLGKTKSSKLNY